MDYFFITEYHDNNGNTKSISININDFNYVEGEIEKAVKYWSGRHIGNLTAKSCDEIVSDKEIPEEEKQRITEKYQKYIPMFEEEKKGKRKRSWRCQYLSHFCQWLCSSAIPRKDS